MRMGNTYKTFHTCEYPLILDLSFEKQSNYLGWRRWGWRDAFGGNIFNENLHL